MTEMLLPAMPEFVEVETEHTELHTSSENQIYHLSVTEGPNEQSCTVAVTWLIE